MTNQIQEFLNYLTEKGRKQAYVNTLDWRLKHIYDALQIQPTSAKVIDNLVRRVWSGYASRDKAVYRFLNDYADFCEADFPEFTAAFHGHVRETFEGEARKAMRAYKNAFVYIPKDTKIASHFLDGITNNRFVNAFKSLQEVIYTIYDNIECGSPFEWGWPAWDGITAEGLNHNRVIMIFDALAESSSIDGDMLIVDKKLFGKQKICTPLSKTKLMLNKLADIGFFINKLDDKDSPVFTLSYSDAPDFITVLYAYFTKERTDKNHVNAFSYRFVEDHAVQTHETFFLAKTDGEPKELRDIYYWHYDEAKKHGFLPQEREYEGLHCYEYKKGSKRWELFLGSNNSYHESDFLHSPPYAISAKVQLCRVFHTHPQITDDLKRKFPDTFRNTFTNCRFERTKNCGETCKRRIITTINNREYVHCGGSYLYFHDPTFDDVKMIYELYKLENNIANF